MSGAIGDKGIGEEVAAPQAAPQDLSIFSSMTSFLAMKWQRSKRVSSHSWVHVSRKCRSLSASSSVPQKVALATVREPVCLAGDGEACGHLVKSLSDSVCPKLRPLPDLY